MGLDIKEKQERAITNGQKRNARDRRELPC